MRQKFSGPGWDAADVAAGGLGALIKHVPHRRGHGAAEEQPEAMPSPDPPPLGPADGSPPPDEVLDLLYRSGEPRDFGATERQWHDLAAVAAWVPERARAAGRGGFASLLDAMTSDEKVRRTDTRLRVSGPDRYRLDFGPRPGRNAPKTIACDGERRWRVYPDRTWSARPTRWQGPWRSWPTRAGCSAPGCPAARSSPTAAGPPASSA